MPYVVIAPNAERHLEELQDERGADDYLIDRLHEHFQAIADTPTRLTEPAKLPHKPNRLMANFVLNDVTGRRWGFTVTLRRTPDENGVQILTVNGAPWPDPFDEAPEGEPHT
jgi:hypothetical protein